jgi:hypothetical protein
MKTDNHRCISDASGLMVRSGGGRASTPGAPDARPRPGRVCFRLCVTLAVLTVVVAGPAGCRVVRDEPRRDTLLLEPDPEFTLPPMLELEALQEEVRRLGSVSREFPARGETEHYALIREALGLMLRTMPTLRGPQVDGAFLMQLRAIYQSQRQLRPESPFLPTDTTVTMGLRAAYNVLVSIAIAGFSTEEAVERDLALMRDRVEELDRVRGPIHRLVAGQAARHAADAMHQMVNILTEELETPSPGREAAETGTGAEAPQE